MCDEDITPLIISGKPPLEVLQQAWLKIYIEYIDYSQNADMAYAQRLQRDIVLLRARLLKVEYCVRYLALQHDDDLVAELRKLNFRFKFNPEIKDQYLQDLKGVIQRCSSWQLQLEMKEAELKAYQDKNKGEKPDRIYFTKILARLAEFNHFRIDPKITTVAEFAIMKNNYIEHCNEIKKQLKKK
jgi:hypothetical protein